MTASSDASGVVSNGGSETRVLFRLAKRSNSSQSAENLAFGAGLVFGVEQAATTPAIMISAMRKNMAAKLPIAGRLAKPIHGRTMPSAAWLVGGLPMRRALIATYGGM